MLPNQASAANAFCLHYPVVWQFDKAQRIHPSRVRTLVKQLPPTDSYLLQIDASLGAIWMVANLGKRALAYLAQYAQAIYEAEEMKVGNLVASVAFESCA